MMPALCSAQNMGNDIRYRFDTAQIQGGYYLEGYYGSNMLDNNFIGILRNGGHIDTEMKDKGMAKGSDLNRVGGEFNTGFYFSDTEHKLFGDWGYYAEASSNTSVGLEFTKDMYELALYGNQVFENDSAMLHQTGYHFRNNKKLTFGLNLNNQLKVGLTFLSFNNWQLGRIESGKVFTATGASYIEMDLFGRFEQGTRANGIGLDFEYRIPLQFKFNGDSLTQSNTVFGARNVGVLFNNSQTTTLSLDTSYYYQGFEITSLNNITNTFVDPVAIQDSLVPVADTGSNVQALPFELYFYKHSIPELGKVQSIFGFRYRNQANAKAIVYLGGDWRAKEHLAISSYLVFGGYNNVQLGTAINIVKPKFRLGINTNNLLSFFTLNSYGRSIGLSLKYIIK